MSTSSPNSFGGRSKLRVGKQDVEIFSLKALEREGIGNVARLPFSLKVLLEISSGMRTAILFSRTIFALSRDGIPRAPRAPPKKKFRSCPRASCFKILPACRRSSISPPCAMPSAR